MNARGTPWTPEQDALLRRFSATKTDGDMADMLGRTEGAIASRRMRLDLRRHQTSRTGCGGTLIRVPNGAPPPAKGFTRAQVEWAREAFAADPRLVLSEATLILGQCGLLPGFPEDSAAKRMAA